MSKLSRQKLILELVQKETIVNQEELRKSLLKQGFDVTQATLSRDIHEIGLVKTSAGYAVSQAQQEAEPARPSVVRLVREFVLEVRDAQNLLVIKTVPGSAQPVAVALDSESWSEIVGTVAGDDTILVISQNRKNAHRVSIRLRSMIG